MLSTPTVDDQVLQDTRRQIRSMAAEVAELARRELPPEEFFREFLNRVVSSLAAIGGAVWLRNRQGALELQYQIALHESTLHDTAEAQEQHTRLLSAALNSGEGSVVPPRSGGEDSNNPSEHLLLLGPLKSHDEVLGVVEVFQRPRAAGAAQRGYLKFLLQMCQIAGDYLKTCSLQELRDQRQVWGQVAGFAAAAHASLDLAETAFAIANEGRQLIGCDRVTVATVHGRRCRLEAISGLESFDQRSNPVRLLTKLCDAVVESGEPLWYSGQTRDLPPQTQRPLEAYVDESQSKLICIVPLLPDEVDDSPKSSRRARRPLGTLIVEQIDDGSRNSALEQRVEVVRKHAALALKNCLEHQRVFLMPLWRALGKSKLALTARNLPKTLLALGAISGLIAALTLVPGDFDLEARGTLEPAMRQDVFALTPGVIDRVLVEHGQAVKEGQPLVELRNVELDVQLAGLRGQKAESLEEINSAETLLLAGKLQPGQREQLTGRKKQLHQKLRHLDEQLALFERKQQQLQVASPIRGEVITWNLHDRLIHRPVERGNMLLSVADPAHPWRLELRVPEDRMGHVAQAQKDLDEELTVEFILATEPGVTYQGTIARVHHRAEVRDNQENTVLVEVDIDKEQLKQLRPGATVIAKLHCGRRAVGYVWFHDLVEFVQSRVLFRL